VSSCLHFCQHSLVRFCMTILWGQGLRASWAMILHSKIGWKKSNLCRFGSGKWIWHHIIVRVAMAGKRVCTCRKECDKYDLIAAVECFWLAHHNDSSRWFAITSSLPICCPSFSFMGGVAKEYITKLGCEKYFSMIRYWALLEMLLGHKDYKHGKLIEASLLIPFFFRSTLCTRKGRVPLVWDLGLSLMNENKQTCCSAYIPRNLHSMDLWAGVNWHPQMHTIQDGWMDGWMDGVATGNTFWLCSCPLFNHGG
jgi:hypothetical protein